MSLLLRFACVFLGAFAVYGMFVGKDIEAILAACFILIMLYIADDMDEEKTK